jgi:hypothetical protein
MRTLVIVGVGLVFGLVLAGCASTGSANDTVAVATNDTAAVVIDAVEVSGEPKSIKITGITVTDTNGEGAVRIFNEQKWGDSVAREVIHTGLITDGVLSLDLNVSIGRQASDKPWTGSGKYYICLQIAGDDGWADAGGHHYRYWWVKDGEVAKYDIKDAVTTLNFSEFVYDGEFNHK